MLELEHRRRQKELEEIVKELATLPLDDNNSDAMGLIADRFLHVYKAKNAAFRHKYSPFFPLLLEFMEDSNDYSVDYLADNLSLINAYIEQQHVAKNTKYDALYRHFFKLQDHINLEIARTQYNQSQRAKMQDIEQQLSDAHKELCSARNELSRANKEIDRAQEKLQDYINSVNQASQAATRASEKADIATTQANSLKNEIITVLSIFSAVVLAFMGGMSFSGSTLESMHASSAYKVIFISVICGLVVFNTICGLMYFIAKIIEKDIFAKCPVQNGSCTCEADATNSCSAFKRLRVRLPYVFWFNVVFLFILVLDVLAWTINLHQIAASIQISLSRLIN